MIGILLLSHGAMAQGMLESAELFFGDDIPQLKAVCLMEGEDTEEYDQRIRDAIAEVDDGHGVVAFCDLMGGTPSNRCAFSFLSDRFQVITGMNFSMFLEFLGQRQMVEDLSELDINELMDVGKDGILNLNSLVKF